MNWNWVKTRFQSKSETPMADDKKIRLREKRLSDASDDYAWELDPELARLDAAIPLKMSFDDYLSVYPYELSHPRENKEQFAIETPDGKHIGNCGYYNLDKDKGQAEIGIMVGNRDYWSQGYGADAITALVDYIFRKLKLNRVHLKTLDCNIHAQRCFSKCGFAFYGRRSDNDYHFILMEMYRKDWEKRQTDTKVDSRLRGND